MILFELPKNSSLKRVKFTSYLWLCTANSRTSVPSPATARMFPSLAHRPWHVFCRVSFQPRVCLSQRSPRFPQLCHGDYFHLCFIAVVFSSLILIDDIDYYHTLCCAGWQSGGIRGLWLSLPDCRVTSLGLGKVHYYSTSGDSKDGPPKSPSSDQSPEKAVSDAAKASPASTGLHTNN